MRLRRLELLRFGKFTDTTLDFPPAAHDFHLVVGANEAGKSTLRRAVLELLFGMPRSSDLAFLHAQPDLRLGALVEDAAGHALAFQRCKSTKAPLRAPDDSAMADSVLAPFLGGVERAFFEQMFALDHGQLVRGGESILDASHDVGQVLFQSAAGIASLGRVREALEEEAAQLWAPRKSGDRLYYAAAARLEAATADLKAASVRTRAWSEAQAALVAIDERIAAARQRRLDDETRRAQLERLRRLAPVLAALRLKQAALDELGSVRELPSNAAEILQGGQTALAVATERRASLATELVRRQADCAAHLPDAAVLGARADIEALEGLRHRVRDHRADLRARQQELEHLLERLRSDAHALGWSTTEADVRARLPSELARRSVGRLAANHREHQQALRAAERAAEDRRREREALVLELASVHADAAPEALRAALAAGQELGDTLRRQAAASGACDMAERALNDALKALGPWAQDMPALRAMAVPSAGQVAAWRETRQQLAGAVQLASERLREAGERAAQAELAARQYAQSRQVVTSAEVREARRQRDDSWQAIRQGTIALDVGAPAVDAAIALADSLVDTQLRSAADAAELTSLRQQAERETLIRDQLAVSADERTAALAAADRQWAERAAEIGLDGLPLAELPDWLSRREQALAAETALLARRTDRDEAAQRIASAARGLRAALAQTGAILPTDANSSAAQANEADTLPELCALASAALQNIDSARQRRQDLAQRIQTVERAVAQCEAERAEAAAVLAGWQANWSGALAQAGLTDVVRVVDSAEGALAQQAALAQTLDAIQRLREERIETMQHDLDHFAQAAADLALRLAPDMAGTATPEDISRALAARLDTALATRERQRAAEAALGDTLAAQAEAEHEFVLAESSLKPLFDVAGTRDPAALLPLVTRSDHHRQWTQEMAALREDLARAGEGGDLDLLQAEVEACDQERLGADLAALGHALAAVQEELQGLAAERTVAEQAVATMAGQANAALAEARRQEALADMAGATERYLKVATAAQLLRFAIARYRDRKQGPLLAHAEAVFAGLTLGRYTRLRVDYDHTPPQLTARRVDGAEVEVAGLSEGTRDQLYLALRLAALALRLEQAEALPLIADDLFITFDDDRATAGLEALKTVSSRTQVIFLTHHEHLQDCVRDVFGATVNVQRLQV